MGSKYLKGKIFLFLNCFVFCLILVLYTRVQYGFENNFDRANPKPTTKIDQSINSLKSQTLEDYITKYDTKLKAQPNIYSKCSEEFGLELVHSWRNTRIDVCSGGTNSGHISCFRRNVYEIPRMLCLISNSKVKMYKPHVKYISSDLTIDSPMYITNRSILEINCDPSIYKWVPKSQWEQNIDNMSKDHILKNVMCLPKRKSMICKSWINHTVFWIDRRDARNGYHFMEDLITTWESLLILQEDPENVEIVVYDGLVANNQLLTAWNDLFGKGVRIIRNNPFPKSTCFNNSIFNVQAFKSHLTQYGNNGKETICESPILQGFRDWVWSKFNISSEIQIDNNSLNKSSQFTMLFISRKTLTRSIKNEAEIFNAISSQFKNWNFIIFRPELLSNYREQVETINKANILVGVHGAGLTLGMFMKPGSYLIEIFMDDRGPGNWHYRSIAKWVGLKYQFIANNYQSYIPVKDVLLPIKQAVLDFEKFFV